MPEPTEVSKKYKTAFDDLKTLGFIDKDAVFTLDESGKITEETQELLEKGQDSLFQRNNYIGVLSRVDPDKFSFEGYREGQIAEYAKAARSPVVQEYLQRTGLTFKDFLKKEEDAAYNEENQTLDIRLGSGSGELTNQADQVRTIQRMLFVGGYLSSDEAITGVMDEKTFAAFQKFERDVGYVTADGKTLSEAEGKLSLKSVLRLSDATFVDHTRMDDADLTDSECIKRIQTAFNELPEGQKPNPPLEINGTLDPRTMEAINTLMKNNAEDLKENWNTSRCSEAFLTGLKTGDVLTREDMSTLGTLLTHRVYDGYERKFDIYGRSREEKIDDMEFSPAEILPFVEKKNAETKEKAQQEKEAKSLDFIQKTIDKNGDGISEAELAKFFKGRFDKNEKFADELMKKYGGDDKRIDATEMAQMVQDLGDTPALSGKVWDSKDVKAAATMLRDMGVGGAVPAGDAPQRPNDVVNILGNVLGPVFRQ